MKKIIAISVFFVLALQVNAQKKTSAIEKVETIDGEKGTVISVKINRAEEKKIVSEWKSRMKDYKGDIKTKDNLITATDITIETIDLNPIRVLAEVRQSTTTEYELIVMFLVNEEAINSNDDIADYTAAKAIVEEFAAELSKEATEKHFDFHLNLLNSLQKDLEKTEKNIEKAEKDIEDAEKTIKEKKEEITENKKKIVELKAKLETQEETVKQAKNENSIFK